MADRTRRREAPAKASQGPVPRSWRASVLWGTAVVGLAIIASATINPLFGRFVHWDWMAGVAPVALATLTLAVRRRWV